ncbi:MAG: DUF86 domain-containing protein [Planctomycetes bacterium]|nr:DUF86 domain-containing protein [Planctomycetota bacterium]
MSDLGRGKVRNLRDAVGRIREVDPRTLDALRSDLLSQESVLLNLQRACQAAIDLATVLCSERGFGTPQDSRDAILRLESRGVVDHELAQRLVAMIGFRNLAMHRYHAIDLAVVRSILDTRLDDLLRFASIGDPSS